MFTATSRSPYRSLTVRRKSGGADASSVRGAATDDRMQMAGANVTRPTYRVAFLQTVMLGNANRYRVLRAAVDADPTVDATWVPLRSWVDDDWLRVLPGWWRVRIRHLLDAARLFLPL